jgi:hypothetical protein
MREDLEAAHVTARRRPGDVLMQAYGDRPEARRRSPFRVP